MQRERLGAWGEDVAAAYLTRAGWTIVSRNFRAGRKEIDLVARRGEVVAFVEVKTRASRSTGHPFEAIDQQKQLRIAKVAQEWINLHGENGLTYRFDAIGVARGVGASPRIYHLPDAWRG